LGINDQNSQQFGLNSSKISKCQRGLHVPILSSDGLTPPS
jgi:hypothetical protein